jgi:hypothetical protein
MESTLGEKRIKTDFNVSGSDAVTKIKQAGAHLIDMAEELVVEHTSSGEAINCDAEKRRLISLAQTAYEQATMWHVKALFYNK